MSTTLEQIQYGFDRNSRRTWQRRSLTETQDQHYYYDTLGQVSAAARGSLNLNATAISGRPASAQGWDYDPTGNWRGYHAAANGTTTLDQHRVHDRGNRLTQIEGNPNNMILDRVGRMRQMAPDASGDWDGKLEITWDAWSRITRVKNNGEVVGDYAYDGSHRRIIREVDGETLHSYYNDAWRPVEERKDAETTASISYLWGSRHRDDLVRRDRAVSGSTLNEVRYVLMDYFNPSAITDEAGSVKERYTFSAFGLRTILNPDFTERSSSECGLEFAFQGQFVDEESGLMNYGYRYYSAPLGRWTCKDPIVEKGGFNLYNMAGDDSVNQVDYLGLDSLGLWDRPPGTDPLGEPVSPGNSSGFRDDVARLLYGDCAVDIFKRWDSAMTQRNIRGGDKWHHCMDNCEVANKCGKDKAKNLGAWKEMNDLLKNRLQNLSADYAGTKPPRIRDPVEMAKDSLEDMKHNATGYECDSLENCECCCYKYHVNGLP